MYENYPLNINEMQTNQLMKSACENVNSDMQMEEINQSSVHLTEKEFIEDEADKIYMKDIALEQKLGKLYSALKIERNKIIKWKIYVKNEINHKNQQIEECKSIYENYKMTINNKLKDKDSYIAKLEDELQRKDEISNKLINTRKMCDLLQEQLKVLSQRVDSTSVIKDSIETKSTAYLNEINLLKNKFCKLEEDLLDERRQKDETIYKIIEEKDVVISNLRDTNECLQNQLVENQRRNEINEKNILSFEDSINEMEQKINLLEDSKKQLSEEKKEMQTHFEHVTEKLQNQITHLKSNLEDLLEKLESEQIKMTKLKDDINHLEVQNENFQKTTSILQDQLANEVSNAHLLNTHKEEAEKSLDKLSCELNESIQQINELNIQIKYLMEKEELFAKLTEDHNLLKIRCQSLEADNGTLMQNFKILNDEKDKIQHDLKLATLETAQLSLERDQLLEKAKNLNALLESQFEILNSEKALSSSLKHQTLDVEQKMEETQKQNFRFCEEIQLKSSLITELKANLHEKDIALASLKASIQVQEIEIERLRSELNANQLQYQQNESKLHLLHDHEKKLVCALREQITKLQEQFQHQLNETNNTRLELELKVASFQETNDKYIQSQQVMEDHIKLKNAYEKQLEQYQAELSVCKSTLEERSCLISQLRDENELILSQNDTLNNHLKSAEKERDTAINQKNIAIAEFELQEMLMNVDNMKKAKEKVEIDKNSHIDSLKTKLSTYQNLNSKLHETLKLNEDLKKLIDEKDDKIFKLQSSHTTLCSKFPTNSDIKSDANSTLINNCDSIPKVPELFYNWKDKDSDVSDSLEVNLDQCGLIRGSSLVYVQNPSYPLTKTRYATMKTPDMKVTLGNINKNRPTLGNKTKKNAEVKTQQTRKESDKPRKFFKTNQSERHSSEYLMKNYGTDKLFCWDD